MHGNTLRQFFHGIRVESFSGVVIARLYQVRKNVYGFAFAVVGFANHYCG